MSDQPVKRLSRKRGKKSYGTQHNVTRVKVRAIPYIYNSPPTFLPTKPIPWLHQKQCTSFQQVCHTHANMNKITESQIQTLEIPETSSKTYFQYTFSLWHPISSWFEKGFKMIGLKVFPKLVALIGRGRHIIIV